MKTKLTAAFVMLTIALQGQAAATSEPTKAWTIDTNTLLVIFAVFLLLPIWILSNTFIASAKKFYTERKNSGAERILSILGILLLSNSLMAQTNQPSGIGLSATGMTILLICVISAELYMIIYFSSKINDFLKKSDPHASQAAQTRSPLEWLKAKWSSMNFKPIEEEQQLDTGHSYDGIRELDNITPPWFTTAFLLTIVFAIGYMYRYHIAKSAPMQIEEYEIAVARAELEHDAYLKTQANNIDESNVAVMTGADLDGGKKTFVTLCAACHKTDGGGLVGPNLCDEYWIHGGSLKDIFRTVKYGVPDKGMISWKEQLTPLQIAQVSNYILTLKGTNPPDAKEKQGELYVAEEVADTTNAAAPLTDTTSVK
jgi:cytochrome c oxidase cbb3-type subunit 3